jgi:S-adenosylmethionine hydrolase
MRQYGCLILFLSLSFLTITNVFADTAPIPIVVLQTDFGVKDSAVSEIKGVMYSVDKSLVITDVTQEIPPFNIWAAAYRLFQVQAYWPPGSVFVSVVDPGVGTQRKSVVALAKNGRYFVTPDNGTLTLIADNIGISEIREIDESKNRLSGSGNSYTFYGRDVYGYTAAKLAAGKISFKEVGPIITNSPVKFAYQKAIIKLDNLYGTIMVLDPNYGNVWSNISIDLANQLKMVVGQKYHVQIFYKNSKKYDGILSLQNTFGAVKKGEPLLYFNSLLNLSIALNQANFAEKFKINSGNDWNIIIGKA